MSKEVVGSPKADLELVQEVIAGQKAAFATLVERHQRALLRLSFRFTREQSQAEDIVQESFIKAYQKIAMFEGRSSFRSWLFQITANTAKNKLRGQRREMVQLNDVDLGVDAGAETGMIQTDIRQRLKTEIERLPEKQRITLKLRIYEDLSFKEISEMMDCPYDTAKANYRHAVLKLRDRLEESESLSDLVGFDSFISREVSLTSGEIEQ